MDSNHILSISILMINKPDALTFCLLSLTTCAEQGSYEKKNSGLFHKLRLHVSFPYYVCRARKPANKSVRYGLIIL